MQSVALVPLRTRRPNRAVRGVRLFFVVVIGLAACGATHTSCVFNRAHAHEVSNTIVDLLAEVRAAH